MINHNFKCWFQLNLRRYKLVPVVDEETLNITEGVGQPLVAMMDGTRSKDLVKNPNDKVGRCTLNR